MPYSDRVYDPETLALMTRFSMMLGRPLRNKVTDAKGTRNRAIIGS